jgi:peptidyl-prolyl cis-trans isomerase C
MRLSKTLQLLLVIAAGALTMNVAQAEDIKVNGVAIPQARLEYLVANAGHPDSPELRTRIKDNLIVREVLAQEAAKKGFDKNPDVLMQIDMQRQEVLINTFLQDYMKTHPITEDAMKKEYDQVKAKSGGKEYKAHHILVETEDEAKQIIDQLKNGGDFEKIAADKSKDTGSKGRGGNLDWSLSSRYVPAFGQALVKLKKGQTTDKPVKTRFGWHVIRLDDVRSAKFPTFEQAKTQIQQQMQKHEVSQLIEALRAKAKVVE